jgi:hypothetical protein
MGFVAKEMALKEVSLGSLFDFLLLIIIPPYPKYSSITTS